MANAPSQAADQVGPFVAGSKSSDLIGLAQQAHVGLRAVDAQEQERDHYRHQYDDLKAAAKEFFYDYDGSASLVFQKAGDADHIPEFIQFVYCWLVQDQLAGLVLLGVSIDAGTHEQIDEQETAFWEQAAEVGQALSSKYAESPDSLVNYFNFALYAVLPRVPEVDGKSLFSAFPRLVTAGDDHETRTKIDTHYWGPSVLLASDNEIGPEVSTSAAHTNLAVRRIFANNQWFVVCTHAVERYVRTIESLHVSTKLVYLSRRVMGDLGRKLNAQRGAQVEEEARREITSWEAVRGQAQDAKQARITKLSRLL